jgi:hypothetical protein
MHSRYRFLVLSLIIVFYAFLYIATRKDPPCENDCPKIGAIVSTLVTKYNYVYGVNRCENMPTGLCVVVMDTPGVDWNHLADTTCFLAKQQNLYAQQVLILKNGSYPYDTLGRAQCP